MSKLPWSENGVENACCCEEEGCCLYPASGYPGLYGSDDMPANFTWNGKTYTWDGSAYVNGFQTIDAIYEPGYWTAVDGFSGGVAQIGTCLAGSLAQFPDFPETLYVGGDMLGSDGACGWFGYAMTLDNLSVSYDPEECKWLMFALSIDYIDGPVLPEHILFFAHKTGNQNDPRGTYGAYTVT